MKNTDKTLDEMPPRIVDQWKVSQSPTSIEGRIFRVHMHSFSYSSFKPRWFHWSTTWSSRKFLDVWTIRALSPPIHRTLVNSRQTELRKRLGRVAKLSSSKRYSKSSWTELVDYIIIYITWMNQNLHQSTFKYSKLPVYHWQQVYEV